MSEAHIVLEGLTKHFPHTESPAVDSLDLTIPRGEIVMLVGTSGCGKTTTLKMINRIIEPDRGRVLIDGTDVTAEDPDEMRRRIGYVIQHVGLFPHMPVGRNVAAVPHLLGWDKKRTAERVDELLALVGLEPSQYRDRYPNQLSGGQRQRVGVARALAADPPVMLMDEPFGAVDPINREHLQQQFLRLQEQLKKTIVFVTHDISEALMLGDRVVVLEAGAHVAQYAAPAELLARPATDFVRSFVGTRRGIRALEVERLDERILASLPVRDRDLAADHSTHLTHTPSLTLADVASHLLTCGSPVVTVVDAAGAPLAQASLDDVQGLVSDRGPRAQAAPA